MTKEVETFLTFEAAHRLYDVNTYSEACRTRLHGHSYGVKVVVGRYSLNEAGMIIDFKLLKEILKETIEDKYDHSCILKSDDPLVGPMKEYCDPDHVHVVDKNPTAEWMADQFRVEITKALTEIDPQLFVTEVAVRETEHNIAISRRS